MPKIALRFEDGVEETFESDPYETVYQAALRAGTPILTDCLEGACATCKARCTSGEYDLVDPSFDALSAQDEAAGFVLLCQMEARAECVVEMPYSRAFAAASAPETTLAVVSGIEPIGSDIVRLALRTERPRSFVPGQYARIWVPGTEHSRAYSFANLPGREELEFYVRRLDDGVMGRYLRERAALGDEVTLELALGGFYLRAAAGPVVFVAGGTGLAPMLSMLRSMATSGSERAVTLLHGARRPSDLFGAAVIEELQSHGLSVDYRPAVDALDPGDGTGRAPTVGPVTELVDALSLEDGTDVYLCGPPAMVERAEALFDARGVPGARVHTERFNPA